MCRRWTNSASPRGTRCTRSRSPPWPAPGTPPLALLLVPFALLVAASRVVLGLHYPSDVLAAIAIGGALATCSILLAGAVGLR